MKGKKYSISLGFIKTGILLFLLILILPNKGVSQHFVVENTSIGHLATFNGSPGMFIIFEEGGIRRGYIGSFSGDPEDVDMGTSSQNPTGKINLTIKGDPKLTIDENGDVSVMDLASTNQGPVYSDGDGRLFTEKSQYAMIPATSFTGENYSASPTGGAPEQFSIGPITAYAPIQLPDGAVVKSFEIIYTDDQSSNLSVDISEKPYNSDAVTDLFTFTSSGAMSGIRTSSSGMLVLPPIDNFGKVYFAEVTLPPFIFTLPPDPFIPYLMSIIGIRILYTY